MYQIATKELTKLFDFQIQEPTFPDGKKITQEQFIFYDLAQKKRCKSPLMVKKMLLSMYLTGFMRKNLLCKSI
jgi:hypothetical protein